MTYPLLGRVFRADAGGVILFVRLRPGLVGETRRTVHVVPVPDRWSSPLVLTAYCGLQIGRGEAELVGEEGMPCEECLISAPPENSPENPPDRYDLAGDQRGRTVRLTPARNDAPGTHPIPPGQDR